MFASSISRVRMVVAVAITAVMALSMALFVAAPARAQHPVGGEDTAKVLDDELLVNSATGRCLDGSITRGVRLEPCNGTSYQDWIRLWGPNPAHLTHKQSGYCLDGSISEGVRLRPCNGSDYQQWEWRGGDNGAAWLNMATRMCLDGSISEGVRLMTCNNSENFEYQRWY